jgi:ABC-type bacteriocin/lantibiotic exporter with double-glycine peptidase domain
MHGARQASASSTVAPPLVREIEVMKNHAMEARLADELRAFALARRTRDDALQSLQASLDACVAAMLLVGGLTLCLILSARPEMTMGTAVLLAVAWLLVAAPVWHAGRSLGDFVALQHMLQSLADVLAIPMENRARTLILPPLRGRLHVNDVSLSLAPACRDVLSHVTLRMAPGRLHWIVGRSGSGKTALTQLLLGLRTPTAGTIEIDGFDLPDVEPASLRRQASFVPQDPVIVRGTIRENIALAATQATLEQVTAAARLAGADDFIERYPLAYDTMLGQGGVQLSSGERMKLALARAFVNEPRLLLLDDPTALLDADSTKVLLHHLRLLAFERMVVIVARKLPDLLPKDVLVVLDEGRVVAQGSPAELLNEPGLHEYLAGRCPT